VERTVAALLALPFATDPRRRVSELVIDYRRFRVAALKVSKPGLFSRTELLPIERVNVTDKGIELREGPAAGAEYQDATRFGVLLGKEVYSERRRHLGRVETFKFDDSTGNATVLWVKTPVALRGLWRQTLIISRDQISEVTPQAVIVDELVVRSAMAPATTAQFAQQDADAVGAV
jgi:sporulation protein YlmC with PRC-barrel domain